MSLILNIDTATEIGHVSFARDGAVMVSLQNELQKDHASFLQPAIQQLSKDTGIKLDEFDAIAVTGGPGSYTGLRVGLSSAKGLVYALNKPLIMLNTLELLTVSAFSIETDSPAKQPALYCPMIDARRMEVFTAIYDNELNVVLSPCAMILDNQSFDEQLKNNKMIFFGSGSIKWKEICNDPNALFKDVKTAPGAMSGLSFKLFLLKQFADPAYSEPFYIKEFQTVTKR